MPQGASPDFQAALRLPTTPSATWMISSVVKRWAWLMQEARLSPCTSSIA